MLNLLIPTAIDVPKVLKDFNVPSEIQNIQSAMPSPNASMQISPDANFSSQSANYSIGQTIYVKLNSNVSGDDKKVLNIRDNQNNILKSYSLIRSGNNPYTYTVTISAPSTDGNYSLEASIQSSASNAEYVQTIKIGNGQNNSSINVNVSQSSTTNDVLSASNQSSETQINQGGTSVQAQANTSEGFLNSFVHFFSSIFVRIF